MLLFFKSTIATYREIAHLTALVGIMIQPCPRPPGPFGRVNYTLITFFGLEQDV